MRAHKLIGPLAAVAVLSLITASGATASSPPAGQIVYVHGGDLWAMTDSGGNQHVLATAAQVGGTIGSGASYYDPLAIQPNGTDIAFNVEAPDTSLAGDCTGLCPGLYTLLGGKVNRLSSVPYRCGNGSTVECESSETDPQVTTTGQVIYMTQDAILAGTCDYELCGPTASTSWQLLYRAIDGSGGATAWPLPAQGQPSDAFPNATGGLYDGVFAADPADPTKIAYAGYYETGLQLGHQCGTDGESLCYPVTVEDSDGDYNETSYDTSGYSGFAFSSDGSSIAFTLPGGIVVDPSTQSVGHSQPQSTTSDPVTHWALEDEGTTESTGGIQGNIAFAGQAGSGMIVFSALNNLYSIPASCFAAASGTTPGCGTFNAADPTSNPDITQLTTNGTASDPNTYPAWTSSSATIEPVPTNNPPPSTFKVSLSASHAQKLEQQKDLVATVKCNVICAFGSLAGIEIKGSKKELDSKQASGQLPANGSETVKLKFSSRVLKTVKKALSKHKPVTAFILVEAKDEAGKEISAHTSFSVKH